MTLVIPAFLISKSTRRGSGRSGSRLRVPRILRLRDPARSGDLSARTTRGSVAGPSRCHAPLPDVALAPGERAIGGAHKRRVATPADRGPHRVRSPARTPTGRHGNDATYLLLQ